MEQRTLNQKGLIMRLILLFLFLIAPLPAIASDELPNEETQVTPEFIKASLDEASKDYEALKIKKERVESEVTTKLSGDDINALMSKLTSATKIEKGTLLEDLAEQVDALKNRVVIERTSALATQSPRKVRVSGSKTIFNYKDTAIYEVTSAVDHVTDIQLKPGESLTTAPTAGDTVRWSVGVMKSGIIPNEVTHLIIKPLDEDIETNLVITTDSHVYQLRLKSGSFHMPVVSWNYPEDFEEKIRQALKRDEVQEATIRPDDLRFSYDIDGDDYSWKPVRVFDDGVKTFIQMPQKMRVTDAPALFLLEDESEPLLVNYRVKGDYYIVDRLFERAELRAGPKRKIRIELDDGKNWFERTFL